MPPPNSFVHPNTVRYRLERAAELLDCDLGSTDQRFQIYLALKIASLCPFGANDTSKPMCLLPCLKPSLLVY